MFLPALLIRDLGFWGYVVFAVPNVVGAAAMGWVLKSPESSRRLIEDHRQAAVLFSQVTQMFHIYWLVWLGLFVVKSFNISPIYFALVPVGFVLMCLPWTKSAIRSQIAAVIVWMISAGLLLVFAFGPPATPPTVDFVSDRPFSADVIWLIPMSVFGFAFCPYLDLTFHRARIASEAPKASRLAFGMGFGVFFFSMILLTFMYAGPFAALTSGTPISEIHVAPWIALYLAMHMALQLCFTMSVHEYEVKHSLRHLTDRVRMQKTTAFALVCAAVVGTGAIASGFTAPYEWLGMTLGELGYRAFLTFYGLIFPTYVYLNIWNVRGRCLRTRTSRSTLVTLIAIVLASPFFFMGFFVRDERYIPAGVAILILAKLFTGSPDRPAPLTQPA